MAKCIFVLQSALIFVAFINFSPAVAHKDHRKFWEECKVAEQVTDEDLAAMKDPNQPKGPKLKCMFTCLGEKAGKLVDNKLNRDAVMEWFKQNPNFNGTEIEIQKLGASMDTCSGISDPDRCENGSKIMECVMQASIQLGLKPHFERGQSRQSRQTDQENEDGQKKHRGRKHGNGKRRDGEERQDGENDENDQNNGNVEN